MTKSGMNQVVAKAEVLIEALPYIRKFANKTVVIKYGGSAMVDTELQENVVKDVALLKLVGLKPILVHGGGKEISKWVKLLGKEPEFISGLRVTDKETMEVAEMVLGKVNNYLVQRLSELGVKAAGVSGKDGCTLQVRKKTLPGGEDIGFVGEVRKVNLDLITTLQEHDFIPVISPIGMDKHFQSYNINADDAACAVAKALHAEKLAFLTDIEGVCKDPEDKSTLISELTVEEAESLITQGIVGGGMLPKLNNCIDAVNNGVGRVHILDGRQQHSLLLEFFTNEGVGTVFTKGEKE